MARASAAAAQVARAAGSDQSPSSRAAGVALTFEPPFSKTCVVGAARWYGVERPIIQMAPRMETIDRFWWIFLHEAAHIILHRGKNFIDERDGVGDRLEQEADRWAEDILVGHRRFARKMT